MIESGGLVNLLLCLVRRIGLPIFAARHAVAGVCVGGGKDVVRGAHGEPVAWLRGKKKGYTVTGAGKKHITDSRVFTPT